MASQIQLLGRVIITAKLVLKSGLRIGAADTGIMVGSINAILRDPLTKAPYIPGSSIKGKMRSLLEKAHARPQNYKVQNVFIHTCKTSQEYGGCPVCPVFGIPADDPALAKFPHGSPTRLVVRDAHLNPDSKNDLETKNLDGIYSELKTEVAIDRLTSTAVPRNQERIPAGAYMNFEAVFSLYEQTDAKRFADFCQALRLLEQDYLGGSGSRGYGQVEFLEIKLVRAKAKTAETEAAPKSYANVTALLGDNSLENWLKEKLETPAPPAEAAVPTANASQVAGVTS